jgi:transcriptional regulator GlxA family with amidase domain
MDATPPRRAVGVLVFDGVQLLDVSGPVEVFTAAARFGAGYDVKLYSPDGGSVLSSSGVRLAVDGVVTDAASLDLLVVAGSDALPRDVAVRESLRPSVRLLAERSDRVASVCTGAFLLADAGYLDNRRATTHWRHATTLRDRYPLVDVQPDAIFVRSDSTFTSAGVTAGIDLALALVENDYGQEIARDVARELVVFLQRPGGQSQFSVPTSVPPSAVPAIRKAVNRINSNPTGDLSVAAIARHAGMSTRHLNRRFQSEFGISPARYVDLVRLEAARNLLEAGRTVTESAMSSGLGSDETLRRLFSANYGVTPAAYQRRFRTAAA